MRKQLGMLASFLILTAATAFAGPGLQGGRAGYYNQGPVQGQNPSGQVYYQQSSGPGYYQQSSGPAYSQQSSDNTYRQRQPGCCPICPPQCPCPPAPCPECKILPKCRYPNQNRLNCWDFITVTGGSPRMCMLGDQYPLDFEVRACDDVCDVVVTTHLPDGVTLLKSTPEAMVEGNKLTWRFGSMSKGEVRCAKVLLKCECEGELCTCFCATATPVRFCSLLCAKPILTCHKCGPECVELCSPVEYKITVSNTGSCAAEDVIVTDTIPCELEHSSGLRTLVYKLGTLAPCQSKEINVCLKAVQRGRACNTAVVSACNADSSSCQACTCVVTCGCDVVKVGPKELPIGKNADYQITLTNTGDVSLTDVVITDTAPQATSIVAANGATICGNKAVWRMRELKAGETVTFNITLYTCTPGCFTNLVHVTNCQGCPCCNEFTTRWKGRPALNVCIVPSENPICIGDHTTYTITLVNQGSEADDNIVVNVRFPNEIKPLCPSGEIPASVSGNVVRFGPFNNLRSRQTVVMRIDAEAVSSGDGRVVVEVSSDSVRTPIMVQDSTIVN